MSESQTPAAPPIAERRPVTTVVHGETRTDDYAWLRDREDPAVIAYLEAENAWAEAATAHLAGFRERLYAELLGRIVETDLTVPVQDGPYLYYTRTVEGQAYAIHCRRKGSMEAPEEILLDENLLAEGHAYFDLGAFTVSPDHRRLAYSVDTSGAEEYALRILDLETGLLSPETIHGTSSNVVWANDGHTLFYVTLDETRRPYRIWRHRIGDEPVRDVLVHHEADGRFFAGIRRTKSDQWLMLHLGSHATTEVRILEADRPEGGFRIVAPRRHGIEYDLAHHGDRFFVTTNEDAVNFRLFETPTADPRRANWTEVLPHRDDVKLDGVETFARHLLIYEREGGLRQLRVRRLADGAEHRIGFPEPVYSVAPGPNVSWDTDTLRFTYTSLVTPRTVVDYGMDDRSWTQRKQQEVKGGYDAAQYASERLWATAPDGTKVPLSLVYRLPLERDGTRPCHLTGYGAYGYSYDPSFSSTSLSLLDRGVIMAIAHVRGGGEMGRRWYEAGRRFEKRNSFTDFIACAEHLVQRRWTASDRLVISGGSAGGLLMGAVTNLRPDLFAGVVADVPFVDVVNTMLDPTLPLTVIEYDEWGNPEDADVYRCIRSYSPYDNLAAVPHPAMLVTAGLNDPRVAYWEPAKYVAKLRTLNTGTKPLLLKTNMGAGHGGASGRYEYLRELAFKYAFILDVLGRAQG
jgi:oligopeptidase B